MKKKLDHKKLLRKSTIITSFVVFCCFICSINTSYGSKLTYSSSLEQIIQQKRITLNFSNTSIKTILQEMKKQSGISFMFKSESDIELLNNLSIDVKNVTVENALNTLLEKTNFTFVIVGETINIVKRIEPKATDDKKVNLKGTIIDAQKKPIPGATVIVQGSTKGAISDDKGNFSFIVDSGDKIEISFIGFKPQEKVITPADKDIVITLVADAMEVEDVVITGYFNRNKSSYTGNATTFTGKELRQVSSSNVLSTLSMIDPSFKMEVNNEFGSDPNKIPDFQIQGSTNIKTEYSNSPNMPTFILDGFEVSSQKVFDLDPNRVKSITILKDAAATAIYGSRAANGVVVVESIIPENGKVRVNYSFNGDFELADLSSYDLMNASEKLQYEVASNLYRHSYPVSQERLDQLYNQKLALVKKGIDTDWIKKPVKDMGFSHKHSVIVDGGDDTFRYSFDLNYRGQSGVMKESGRDNYGIGVKLQYNYKSVKFSNDLTVGNTKSYNSPYGSFAEYSKLNPYYHPYDENGNVIYQLFDAVDTSDSDIYNPLFNSTINTKDQNNAMNFAERFSFEWDVFKGFKFRAKASIDRETFKSDVFKPNRHTSFAEETEYKGKYEKIERTNNSYDINLMASYFLNVKKHNINAIVLYDLRESKSDTYSFSAYNFPNDNFDHISMSTKFKEGDRPTGTDDISRLMGVAFNGNYNYDNRYLVDFSVRSDASSVFGSNKRWGTFYSIGAGWNINKEAFLKDSKVINNLKLRSSFGTTGGQNFNPYQAMMMYSYKDGAIDGLTYGDEIGALIMAYGNPNLKWQVTQKFNVGVDFSLLDNRLSGYVNYYQNLTKDKLIDFTVAPSTGFSNYTENLGNVDNKGFEINVKGTIIRNVKTDIRWDVFVNLVSNDNKLKNINNALTAYNEKQNDFINDNKDNDKSNKPVVKYMEGQSINTLWANRSLGIDPASGSEVFLDLYGRRTNVYDVRNDMPIATTDPDFEGNFGTMFSYKGFTLNAYFGFSVGGYIYNTTLVNKIENVNPQFNGDKRILYDRWKKAGDVAKFKSISNTEITYPTSRFIEKENFLKLSSISVSYQFEIEKLKKCGIEMLKVGAIGNDIFRASTVKMERGISYPFARTYTLNVQLTF